MDAILLLLYARPLRASEIAANLGFETKYVSSYLSYWKKRGLIYQEGGRWHLTERGESIARDLLEGFSNSKFKEMMAIAKQLISEQVSDTRNNKRDTKEDKVGQKSLSFIASKTSSEDKKRQENVCGEALLSKLDGDERELMRYLVSKFREWGSTYVYLDQIQEELKADPHWTLKTLRGLQTKKLIYLYNDPKLGMRVGFSQKFKDSMDSC
ncbi:replication initiator protein WhiP [Sulfodiicoccus acidiphilus]|nr:replication initiator protein WhiP [Sulfodiicoccus acidiphilus]